MLSVPAPNPVSTAAPPTTAAPTTSAPTTSGTISKYDFLTYKPRRLKFIGK